MEIIRAAISSQRSSRVGPLPLRFYQAMLPPLRTFWRQGPSEWILLKRFFVAKPKTFQSFSQGTGASLDVFCLCCLYVLGWPFHIALLGCMGGDNKNSRLNATLFFKFQCTLAAHFCLSTFQRLSVFIVLSCPGFPSCIAGHTEAWDDAILARTGNFWVFRRSENIALNVRVQETNYRYSGVSSMPVCLYKSVFCFSFNWLIHWHSEVILVDHYLFSGHCCWKMKLLFLTLTQMFFSMYLLANS